MTETIWFRSNSSTHRWLSNFWLCPVSVWGLEFPSAEHAYQAVKTWPEHRQLFLLGTALQAKRRGREVPLRPDFQPTLAMEAVLRAKFEDPELRRLLLETGDTRLVEDNPGPWGGRNGGENRLGKMLMNLREELITC